MTERLKLGQEVVWISNAKQKAGFVVQIVKAGTLPGRLINTLSARDEDSYIVLAHVNEPGCQLVPRPYRYYWPHADNLVGHK